MQFVEPLHDACMRLKTWFLADEFDKISQQQMLLFPSILQRLSPIAKTPVFFLIKKISLNINFQKIRHLIQPKMLKIKFLFQKIVYIFKSFLDSFLSEPSTFDINKC